MDKNLIWAEIGVISLTGVLIYSIHLSYYTGLEIGSLFTCLVIGAIIKTKFKLTGWNFGN